MTKRTIAVGLSAGSLIALGMLASAGAETTTKEAAAKMEMSDTVKPVDTATDHLALADDYRKKTAVYREDAATHRQMLETYKKQVTIPADAKTGRENTYVKKMRLHCAEYIREADTLAASAEKFAEFHAMRAAELQGK